MFSTRFTRLLNIDYPIMQGGMHWVSRAPLVAAVSNAGGLGTLSALTFPSPQELAGEIRKTRTLTDRPFAVNLTLLPTLRPVSFEAYVGTIIDEGVKIVETAGRSPAAYMSRLKSAGIKVIHKCTSVRFAANAEQLGCDVVSIDGFECAGHPGEEDVTSLVLVPRTVDTVKIPVIASGGFGDGRGLVAALALGAEGINMGTRFLATKEASIHPAVHEMLVQATEVDTILLGRTLRNTRRVYRNAIAEKIVEMEKDGASLQELAPLISGLRGKELLETGDLNRGVLACGQVVGLVRSIPKVAEVIDSIMSEARNIIEQRLHGSADGLGVCPTNST